MIGAILAALGEAVATGRSGVPNPGFQATQTTPVRGHAKLSRSTRSERVHRVDNYPTISPKPAICRSFAKMQVARMWVRTKTQKPA